MTVGNNRASNVLRKVKGALKQLKQQSKFDNLLVIPRFQIQYGNIFKHNMKNTIYSRIYRSILTNKKSNETALKYDTE